MFIAFVLVSQLTTAAQVDDAATYGEHQTTFTTENQTRYEGPTKESDTLWSIATRYLPKHADANVYQAVGAIFRLNPNAFEDGNIHGLIPGSFLALPTMSEIERENSREIARLLRVDRIKKLEKEAQEKAEQEKAEQLAKIQRIQSSHVPEVEQTSAQPLKTDSTDHSRNLSQNTPQHSIQQQAIYQTVHQVGTASVSYSAIENQTGFESPSSKAAPIQKESTAKSSQSADDTVLSQTAMLDVEVDQLTATNSFLTERLALMEKELTALKTHIKDELEVKAQIQKFIDEQRQLSEQSQFTEHPFWQKMSSNLSLLLLLSIVPALLLICVLAFFIGRRSQAEQFKYEQRQIERIPPLEQSFTTPNDEIDHHSPIEDAPIIEKDIKKEADVTLDGFDKSPPKAPHNPAGVQNSDPEPAPESKSQYVVGLGKNEVIDLSELSDFNEMDAMQAVLDEAKQGAREHQSDSKAIQFAQDDEAFFDSQKKLNPDPLQTTTERNQWEAPSFEEGRNPPQTDTFSLRKHDGFPDHIRLDALRNLNASNSIHFDETDFNVNAGLDDPHAMKKIDPISFDQEHDWALQLDLANTYIEMNDISGAIELLEQVLKSNDQTLRQRAREMLTTLR